jgi:hemerythrin-like domain-containing protein
MKATQSLMHEHKLILRALDVLDAIGASVDQTNTVQESVVGKILDFLRWFADAHHQAKEETVFFPALTAAASSQGRSVEHLTHEHNQDRSLIERMEGEFRLANLDQFVAAAARLSSMLRNHIYKEDRLLFETADTVLTPEQDSVLSERLSRFDTAVDKNVMDEKLKDLRTLEWQYLRKH